MAKQNVKPLKGFWDRYPETMVIQNYIFSNIRTIGKMYGFDEIDGPLLEPLDLYAEKTSQELLEEQSFSMEDRKGRKIMLRPEWTPSLARLVAARAQEMTFPARLMNIGLRYRYEAPQKGRNREFYQCDFDILGADGMLPEIELLSLAVDIFKSLGATQDMFEIRINNRELLQNALKNAGVTDGSIKNVIKSIDRMDKGTQEEFENDLKSLKLSDETITSIREMLSSESYSAQFNDFMELCKNAGISEFVVVDPSIVRGLDYYTGFVFEIKSKGELNRSLCGGGRYDNLIEKYGNQQISGVGFALSDTILNAFLEDFNLTPELDEKSVDVLMTVFSEDTKKISLKIAQKVRKAGFATEIFPQSELRPVKLQKQMAYANKRNIPIVLVIGPDELEREQVVIRDMNSNQQKTVSQSKLIQSIEEILFS